MAAFSFLMIVPSMSPKQKPLDAVNSKIAVQSRNAKKELLSRPNIQNDTRDTTMGYMRNVITLATAVDR